MSENNAEQIRLQEKVKRVGLWGLYLGAKFTQGWMPSLSGKLASVIWFSPIRMKNATLDFSVSASPELIEIKSTKRPIKAYRFQGKDRSQGTVVLVHGWAGSMKQFEEMTEHLISKGKTVVVFDFPSHGLSSGLSTDLVEMGEVLAEVIQKCDGPVNLVCHSFGLIVAANAISQQKSQVQKIVSISSPITFNFLVDQFLSKTKLNEKIRNNLVSSIQKRVTGRLDVKTQIDIPQKLFVEKHWLAIHDESDREVPFLEFQNLKKRYPNVHTFTTKGFKHNRILTTKPVFDAVVGFLDANLG